MDPVSSVHETIRPSYMAQNFRLHFPLRTLSRLRKPDHGHEYKNTPPGSIANRPTATGIEMEREGEGQSAGRFTQVPMRVTSTLSH